MDEGMKLSLLHEKAGAQYRMLWYDINRLLVDSCYALRGEVGAIDPTRSRFALSATAYRICQYIRPAEPQWLSVIRKLESNSDTVLKNIHVQNAYEQNLAAHAAKLAARHALLLLNDAGSLEL